MRDGTITRDEDKLTIGTIYRRIRLSYFSFLRSIEHMLDDFCFFLSL